MCYSHWATHCQKESCKDLIVQNIFEADILMSVRNMCTIIYSERYGDVLKRTVHLH